jgi:hypothetical protein
LASVAELDARWQAERRGRPFLLLRDGAGRQRIVGLPDAGERVVIGREAEGGIRLDWDSEVSRATPCWSASPAAGRSSTTACRATALRQRGSGAGAPATARRRRHPLRPGGHRLLRSAQPRWAGNFERPEPPPPLHISPAQRRVLIELCRPLRDAPYAVPATNKAIAAELSLGVDAVKTHLRRLAEILSVDRLPRRRSPHGCS